MTFICPQREIAKTEKKAIRNVNKVEKIVKISLETDASDRVIDFLCDPRGKRTEKYIAL